MSATPSPPYYDPTDPLGALARIGVTMQRGASSSSSIDLSSGDTEVPLFQTSGETYNFTLPGQVPLNASFGKEDIVKKLTKLFRSEPQAGDPEFDDRVYVSASDKAQVERFLQNADVRQLLLEFVAEGGLVTVCGNRVDIKAVSKGAACIVTDTELARFVCHVMAFR